MVFDVDWPWVPETFPPLESKKSKEDGGGVVDAFTVNVNEVDLVSDPARDVTLTVWFPVGVVESVEILSVVEQVGVQEG